MHKLSIDVALENFTVVPISTVLLEWKVITSDGLLEYNWCTDATSGVHILCYSQPSSWSHYLEVTVNFIDFQGGDLVI